MHDLPLIEYRKKSQQSLVAEQDRSNSQIVYDELYNLLLTQGYGSITLQQISKLTGISRTTLYRRWSSIDALILDAIAEKVQDFISIAAEIQPLDSLKTTLKQLAVFLQSPLGRAFLQASLSIQDEVSLRKRDDLWQQRYQQITTTFQRLLAQDKQGQCIDDIISMTLGSFYFHIFIQNQEVSDHFIDSIVRNTLTLLQSK